MSDDLTPQEQLRLARMEATERLVDALTARGFQEGEAGHWQGRLQLPTTDAVTGIEVTIPEDYPFVAPTVTPLTREQAPPDSVNLAYYEVTHSWHREPNGRLCLFEDQDHTRLPWADPEQLLDQTEAWIDQDRQGWPADQPTLDLERYLTSSGRCIRFDESLARMDRMPVQLRHVRGELWQVASRAKPPRGRRGRRRGWTGDVAFVYRIGEVSHPIRNWESLLAATGDHGPAISAEVRRGLRHLILLYRRGGNEGVLALELQPEGSSWTVTAHCAAPADAATLTRRAHPEQAQLAQHRVAVVGVGAVGSVIADLLHRSAIGELHLVDHDLVLPGNLVRHLAGDDKVGCPKVIAVAETLQRSRPGATCRITTQEASVRSLSAAVDLLTGYDVVVDATADSTASSLLGAAALAGAGRLVSVAVLADGYAVRVDHIPPPEGEALAPPSLPAPASTPENYETGCGSPLSTTPPAAAWEAAALGARHTIDALLRVGNAGEERIIQAETASGRS